MVVVVVMLECEGGDCGSGRYCRRETGRRVVVVRRRPALTLLENSWQMVHFAEFPDPVNHWTSTETMSLAQRPSAHSTLSLLLLSYDIRQNPCNSHPLTLVNLELCR